MSAERHDTLTKKKLDALMSEGADKILEWKQRYESLAEIHARVLRERDAARRERDEARSALREIYAEARGFLDTWDPLR